jgi:succinylglutamate desuccinylase
MLERVIGRFVGRKNNPLVLVFAGVHGNETAGIAAVERALHLLQTCYRGGDQAFAGTLLALRGNLPAIESGRRFIDRDLNRMWSPEHLERIKHSDPDRLQNEDRQMVDLLDCVHDALQTYQPETLVMLDLHTTSADGGVFCIPAGEASSLRLAKALHAPVVLGLLDGIQGSLLHFAEGNHFAVGGFPKHTIGVAFEGGRHADPASVDHCLSAVIHTLRATGCIADDALAGCYDDVLQKDVRPLPKVTRLRYVHSIRPGDGFVMRPGYLNFQPIHAGEHLADDVEGPILARCDGMVLMPLYQSIGSDGFFVVEALE